MRRNFDKFLHEKIKKNTLNIIYIDLMYLEKKEDSIELTVALKEKMEGKLGINWTNYIIEVELDFSLKEFKSTCIKYYLDYSVFAGDWENYFNIYR